LVSKKIDHLFKKNVDELTGREQLALFFKYLGDDDKDKKNLICELSKRNSILDLTKQTFDDFTNDYGWKLMNIFQELQYFDRKHNEAAIRKKIEKATEEARKKAWEKAVSKAREMLKDGIPVDKIVRYTDLTHEEVEKLQN
jgi:hypothetical protein